MSLSPLFTLTADAEITITIRDHKFHPAEVRVPAGHKVKIIAENQDPTPEECESHELNREIVIALKSVADFSIRR